MPGELVKNGGAGLVKPLDEIADAVIAWTEADAVH
jgi:two-component system chemotaxis response regulator CheB